MCDELRVSTSMCMIPGWRPHPHAHAHTRAAVPAPIKPCISNNVSHPSGPAGPLPEPCSHAHLQPPVSFHVNCSSRGGEKEVKPPEEQPLRRTLNQSLSREDSPVCGAASWLSLKGVFPGALKLLRTCFSFVACFCLFLVGLSEKKIINSSNACS